MINDKLLSIRSLVRRSHNSGMGTPGRRSVLAIVSASLLSSMASGQVPTTTALPYLLKSPGKGIVVLAPATTVVQVPPAVTLGGFGSLLGGGFNSLLSEPIAAAATAAAIASIRGAAYLTKANFLQANVVRADQAIQQADQNIRSNNADLFACDDEFTPVKFNHHLKPASSSVCSLPQEETAQEAEEELQVLNEAGDTSQEAIEAAEATAEAAESAAEAAEAAAEAVLDTVDVLEGVLEVVEAFPKTAKPRPR